MLPVGTLPSRALALAALLVVQVACTKPENQEAKARVFAPPPPSPSQQRGQVKLDINKVASDAVTRTHVRDMLFPEVHVRAGAGVFNVKETLTLQKGPAAIAVVETGSIRFNQHGDMAVDLSTGTTERMQLVYANQVMYTKNRAGSWRVSRDPAEERHFWADNTYAAFRTTLEMLKDDVTWTVDGRETVEGRAATRFKLALSGAPRQPGLIQETMADGGTTRVPLPDGGTAHETARARRAALKGATPQSAEGTVVLDDEKLVPRSVNLNVVMLLPSGKSTEHQQMTIAVESSLTEWGKDADIKGPDDAVEEIARKRVPPDPLEWLDGGTRGKAAPAKGAKGQKPAAPRTEEPPEDGEE